VNKKMMEIMKKLFLLYSISFLFIGYCGAMDKRQEKIEIFDDLCDRSKKFHDNNVCEAV